MAVAVYRVEIYPALQKKKKGTLRPAGLRTPRGKV